jgi:hypothetical protein
VHPSGDAVVLLCRPVINRPDLIGEPDMTNSRLQFTPRHRRRRSDLFATGVAIDGRRASDPGLDGPASRFTAR